MKEFLMQVEGLVRYYQPFVEKELDVSLGQVSVHPIDEVFPDRWSWAPRYATRKGIIFANYRNPLVSEGLRMAEYIETPERRVSSVLMHRAILEELVHQVHYVVNPEFGKSRDGSINPDDENITEQDRLGNIIAEGLAGYLTMYEWSPVAGLYIVNDPNLLKKRADDLLQKAKRLSVINVNSCDPYSVGYRFFAQVFPLGRFSRSEKEQGKTGEKWSEGFNRASKEWLDAVIRVAQTNDARAEEIKDPNLYVHRMNLPRRVLRKL